MKAADYPGFEKFRSQSNEEEISLLRKLIWLEYKGVVGLGSYNEKKDTWDSNAYAFLILNDTFDYATADAEGFEEEDLDQIFLLHHVFGYHGLIAWAAQRRDREPLEKLRTPQYLTATRYLKGELDITFDDPYEVLQGPLTLSDPQLEVNRLHKLIWLASRDTLCFCEKDRWSLEAEGVHCFGNVYAFSVHGPVNEETIDLLFHLDEKFGGAGLDAWEAFINPREEAFLRSLAKGTQGNLMLTEKFEEALAYLKGQSREA